MRGNSVILHVNGRQPPQYLVDQVQEREREERENERAAVQEQQLHQQQAAEAQGAQQDEDEEDAGEAAGPEGQDEPMAEGGLGGQWPRQHEHDDGEPRRRAGHAAAQD